MAAVALPPPAVQFDRALRAVLDEYTRVQPGSDVQRVAQRIAARDAALQLPERLAAAPRLSQFVAADRVVTILPVYANAVAAAELRLEQATRELAHGYLRVAAVRDALGQFAAEERGVLLEQAVQLETWAVKAPQLDVVAAAARFQRAVATALAQRVLDGKPGGSTTTLDALLAAQEAALVDALDAYTAARRSWREVVLPVVLRETRHERDTLLQSADLALQQAWNGVPAQLLQALAGTDATTGAVTTRKRAIEAVGAVLAARFAFASGVVESYINAPRIAANERALVPEMPAARSYDSLLRTPGGKRTLQWYSVGHHFVDRAALRDLPMFQHVPRGMYLTPWTGTALADDPLLALAQFIDRTQSDAARTAENYVRALAPRQAVAAAT